LALSYWIDYLGFITEGILATVLITPSLGVPNWSVIFIINTAPSGYESREFQDRKSRGKEKLKYSGPSAEDMLHGPCHIHYAYLDGKRVSNHQMKDCRAFLRLQGALDSNQGTHQGGRNTSQGYQIQRLAKHLESKVYISAMIQSVPKSKKEQKSISRQVNLAISSPPATIEYLRWSDQPVKFSRADHPRKVPRLGHAPMVLKAQIGGYNIGRVFMDAGSGINLIYAITLRAMSISMENLKPTDCSFHGIVPPRENQGAQTTPSGKPNSMFATAIVAITAEKS
jgi:hypothetical protein